MIYWNKTLAKETYKKLCEDNGNKSLSQITLKKLGYSSLPQIIIKYWGTKQTLEEELGFKVLKKSWTKSIVKSEYQKLCFKNGNKPLSQCKLKKEHGLTGAILKFYKSKNFLDEELGYVAFRTPWTKDMVKSKYHEICLSNGDKPCSNLDSIKGLEHAIRRYWNSKEELEISIGYVPIRLNSRTKESIIEEYKKLCLENGNKPLKHDELNKIGNLSYAIMHKFGSKMELDSLLGYKPLKFYGWNKEKVKESYHKLCLENGDKMLSYTNLLEMGQHDLVSAFYRHCKKNILDVELGYEIKWNKELVKKTYSCLCIENGGRAISVNELKLFGHENLPSEIRRYFKSKSSLDIELGYFNKNLFLLSNGDVVRSSYEVIFGNYLIHNEIEFKVDKKIEKKGKKRYDFLIKDIFKNDVYVEIWGYTGKYKSKKKDRVYYYNLKRVEKESLYRSLNKKLISLEGELFKKRNFLDLQNELKKILINNNIKLKRFKNISIVELMESKSKSKWSREIVLEKYYQLCKENGYKPVSVSEIIDMGLGSLRKAIDKYWGGKKNIDEHLGYEPHHIIWSTEKCLNFYHKICVELNVKYVNSSVIRKMQPGLDGSIYKLFTSRKVFNEEYKRFLTIN